MTERKPLRMDSVTHEDIDPNSVLGRAILSGNRAEIRKAAARFAKERKDRDAMEEWARADFQSQGLTVEDRPASLEVEEYA